MVQIYLQNISSREPAGAFNRFYVVESIGHALTGEETLSLSHFPVDSSGRSLIALAVAGATAPGQILSSNRTGSSCDVAGASSSTAVPASSTSGTPISSQGTGGTYWAAGGQFLDLFHGFGSVPADAPPAPGSGGGTRLAQGGGAIPPSNGTNSQGGDARCPFGYNRVSGYIHHVQLTGPGVDGPVFRTTYFTATSFPTVESYSTGHYGEWTIQSFTISWNDPTTGPQSGTFDGVSGVDGTYPLDIGANSYSCSLEDGSAGPTVSNASGVPRLYRTQEGDTFGSISQKFYGTTSRAADIANANPWLMGINIFAVDSWGTWEPGSGFLLTIPN